jgi:6-pyruvoyltetrahydropterin/6-carboxytetrahydropterin synthase
VPTTENLSREVWRIFTAYADATLVSVRIEETGNNSFDYYGEGAAQPQPS